MPKTPIDPATGLPELPEGYFWKVGVREGSANNFEIVLCQRNPEDKSGKAYTEHRREYWTFWIYPAKLRRKARKVIKLHFGDPYMSKLKAKYAGQYPPLVLR